MVVTYEKRSFYAGYNQAIVDLWDEIEVCISKYAYAHAQKKKEALIHREAHDGS